MPQLLEYHTEVVPAGIETAEHPLVIDGVHDILVKSIDIALVNGIFIGSQWGYAYFWRNAQHYTMMMPHGPNLPMSWTKDFGANYLLLPANPEEQVCLVTQFPGGKPTGIVYDISILYLLPA